MKAGLLKWVVVGVGGLSLLALGCGAESRAENNGEIQLGIGGSPGASCGAAFGGFGTEYCFRQGVTLTHGVYTGARDATLDSLLPTTYAGASINCLVGGSSLERSCVLRWDLTDIPTTAVVVAVSLEVFLNTPSPSTYYIYGLKKAWLEAEVNWQKYDDPFLWQLPGAKGSADVGPAFCDFLPSTTGSLLTTFGPAGIGVVQGWVTTPTSNRGLVIANAAVPDGFGMTSRDAADVWKRPALRVRFH
jgi:hypothetical protein